MKFNPMKLRIFPVVVPRSVLHVPAASLSGLTADRAPRPRHPEFFEMDSQKPLPMLRCWNESRGFTWTMRRPSLHSPAGWKNRTDTDSAGMPVNREAPPGIRSVRHDHEDEKPWFDPRRVAYGLTGLASTPGMAGMLTMEDFSGARCAGGRHFDCHTETGFAGLCRNLMVN